MTDILSEQVPSYDILEVAPQVVVGVSQTDVAAAITAAASSPTLLSPGIGAQRSGAAKGDGTTTTFVLGKYATLWKQSSIGTWPLYPTSRTTFARQFNIFTADSSGTGSVPTVTPNYSTAPDGTLTAYRVQLSKTAGVGFSRYWLGLTVASARYCDSIWLKTNDGSYVSAVLRNFGDGQPISITPTWTRFSSSNPSANTTPQLQVMLWDTFGSSLTADLSVWGPQIETGDTSQSIAPNDARIGQSDYCAIGTKDATKVRLVRPVTDGQGFETCNPGARIARFKTNSRYVGIKVAYTGLVTRADTYNAISWVLVDGVPARAFSYVQNIGSSYSLLLELYATNDQLRTYEVLCPYSASVDFTGLELEVGAMIMPADARPSTRLVVCGDSITHGFWASEEVKTWPYLLGSAKTWEVVNFGYGARACTASDGTALANLAPTVAAYLIGYNNFSAQTPLATFKANYKSFITNFRAVSPLVKLYCITPTWSSNTNTLTLENYRQQIRDALTELSNPLNVLVEGTTLTSSPASFNGDGIHPNDVGSAEISAALAALVAP